MKLFISTGNSRMEKRWNGREMELEEFIGRISTTIRTSETVEQYRKQSKMTSRMWEVLCWGS